MELIDKSALVAEIEKRKKRNLLNEGAFEEDIDILSFIDTLEVKDPYEQRLQHDSIKAGIQDYAETYSFNIESQLFPQLTKEQQTLWRKEIEQACISGGEAGVELARDPRYKENLEVKEVDLEDDVDKILEANDWEYDKIDFYKFAKHFFELGLSLKAQKGE